jgi:hypothetical protein
MPNVRPVFKKTKEFAEEEEEEGRGEKGGAIAWTLGRTRREAICSCSVLDAARV